MKKKNSFGRFLLGLFGFLLAVVLVIAAAFFFLPLTETVDTTPVEGSADWMKELDGELPLNQIVLPGSHDSATQYVQLAFFSKCQALSIEEQLEAGCRYLDIRLGVDGHNDTFKLMHGFTNCRTSPFNPVDKLYLDDLLDDCYAFLKKHPTETVVFAVKQEHGKDSVAVFESMLNSYIREDADKWLLTDTIPTLDEARGKLVLMRRYEDEGGLEARSGIPLIWEDQKGAKDTRPNVVAEKNDFYTLYVQDRFEYDTEAKWEAFTKGMAMAEKRAKDGDVILSFLSTKGSLSYGHPRQFANELNPRLAELDSLSGWVVVDFLSPKLAETIYQHNFQ